MGHATSCWSSPAQIDTDIWRSGQTQLDTTVAAMSDEHRRLYAPLLEGTRKLVIQTADRAAPVDKVVDVIEEAVTKERPRARYVAGVDAKIQIGLRTLLPTRAFDWLMARLHGVA